MSNPFSIGDLVTIYSDKQTLNHRARVYDIRDELCRVQWECCRQQLDDWREQNEFVFHPDNQEVRIKVN